jgi:hypothetical protein
MGDVFSESPNVGLKLGKKEGVRVDACMYGALLRYQVSD